MRGGDSHQVKISGHFSIEVQIFIFSAIEFLHKKFGKYLQPGGESGDLTGVVTGELPPKYFESFLDKYLDKYAKVTRST